MTLSERQCQFTITLANLIVAIQKSGHAVKIQELNRTIETQKQYIAEGVSKTLDSRHLDKLAADLILFQDGLVCNPHCYREFGELWEAMSGRWGGRFGVDKSNYATQIGWDPDHFEFTKEGVFA